MDKDISFINKYIKYERADWIAQRLSWGLMGLFLVLGLLGVFGDSGGILNDKKIKLANGIIVEYPRFHRVEKGYQLKLTLDKSTKGCLVSFNSNYLDYVKISQVIPEPEEVKVVNGRLIYTFNSFRSGSITFFQDPLKMGPFVAHIEVNGKKATLSQYTYF